MNKHNEKLHEMVIDKVTGLLSDCYKVNVYID